jgi:hypothetical protein
MTPPLPIARLQPRPSCRHCILLPAMTRLTSLDCRITSNRNFCSLFTVAVFTVAVFTVAVFTSSPRSFGRILTFGRRATNAGQSQLLPHSARSYNGCRRTYRPLLVPFHAKIIVGTISCDRSLSVTQKYHSFSGGDATNSRARPQSLGAVEPAENGTTHYGDGVDGALLRLCIVYGRKKVFNCCESFPSALVVHVATSRVWCGCGNFLSVGSIDARKVKRGQAGLAGL